MGAGEAKTRGKLGVIVVALVRHELLKDCLLRRHRVGDGADGPVRERQLLPPAGAFAVGARGIVREELTEAGAVIDEHRAALRHAEVEIGERVEQRGVLLRVAQDARLVVVEAVILAQRRVVARAELGEREVHEAPPCRGAVADEQEIVGAEIDGIQHAREITRALAGDLIDAHFPALAAGQLNLHGKVAAAGKDAAGEPCRVGVKGDHLLLRAGAGRLGAGEIDGGLEQVRLALRVLADDDVDRGIEGHALVRVVAEMLQRDGVKSHIRR